jgi:hypothetical protein
MNAPASIAVRTAASTAVPALEQADRGHRIRLLLAWLLAVAMVLVIAGYGYDYYTLGALQRPFSPKHDALRPSGTIGIKLGMFGVLLFFLIYLYPLRKNWGWLARKGNSRHWLDFHVVLGTAAPLIIAFHSSFKFGNIAGMAFWSMLAVTLSGFIGRYLYSQVPRRLNAAELSFKELRDTEKANREDLTRRGPAFRARMKALYNLPDPIKVAKSSTVVVLFWMIFLDFKQPLRISLLRLQGAGFLSWLLSFCGLLATGDHHLEQAIGVARKQAAFSKRILFLARTQRVFYLWHVIHRPFSYSFAILALVHIAVALLMGYRM